jgi:hypothetical protein
MKEQILQTEKGNVFYWKSDHWGADLLGDGEHQVGPDGQTARGSEEIHGDVRNHGILC